MDAHDNDADTKNDCNGEGSVDNGEKTLLGLAVSGNEDDQNANRYQRSLDSVSDEDVKISQSSIEKVEKLEQDFASSSSDAEILQNLPVRVVTSTTNRLKDVCNSEALSNKFEQSEVYQDLLLLSQEGIELSDARDHQAGSKWVNTSEGVRAPQHSSRSFSSQVGELDAANSIFDFVENPHDQLDNGRSGDTIPTFSDHELVGECMFTDIAIHFHPGRRSRGQDELHAATLYWVREDRGTLGSITIGHRTRRVLLRGLKKPTHVQVVEDRVFWLERGEEWQFNGRVSFMDCRTRKVHTLLSGLNMPRGLDVTGECHVTFIETQTVHQGERGDSAENVEDFTDGEDGKIILTARSDVTRLRWKTFWRICGIHGDHVSASVPGANFQLASYKCVLAIIPSAKQLWMHLAHHHGLLSEHTTPKLVSGSAQPHDLASFKASRSDINDGGEPVSNAMGAYLAIAISLHTTGQRASGIDELQSRGGAIMYIRLNVPTRAPVDETDLPGNVQDLRILKFLESPAHSI